MKGKPIDFVLTWVDGNDPKWLNDKNRFKPDNILMNGQERFRDWDNLQYLFRSFEQFTPWVNKIHFVTYGHIPKWLNVEHPKLNIVKHEDFLDKANLPLFNINPIEINFHRISGLSQQFVYFNDDTFVLKPLNPNVFFKRGLPVCTAICNTMHEGAIAPIVLNDIDLLNKNFNRHVGEKLTKRGIIKKDLWKWFYPLYGKGLINNLLLLYWKTFTGFVTYHHPFPFLKSTFEEVWQKEAKILHKTSNSKFRHNSDVNQYLFRYWQFAKGNFFPESYNNAFIKRKYVELRSLENVKSAAREIASGDYQMYCINDSMSKGRFTSKDATQEEIELSINLIKSALDTLLPIRSQFELDKY